MVIQALADGGVKMGLNRDQATRLAAQAMLVKLLLQGNWKGEGKGGFSPFAIMSSWLLWFPHMINTLIITLCMQLAIGNRTFHSVSFCNSISAQNPGLYVLKDTRSPRNAIIVKLLILYPHNITKLIQLL